jgi:hypothetical protein
LVQLPKLSQTGAEFVDALGLDVPAATDVVSVIGFVPVGTPDWLSVAVQVTLPWVSIHTFDAADGVQLTVGAESSTFAVTVLVAVCPAKLVAVTEYVVVPAGGVMVAEPLVMATGGPADPPCGVTV